ncbi:hypothetical protein GH714_017905 [Hevea brasiliensis]|uniref:Uncharacterized protein n=1 Tax=Hevea brasiliensis TaxID=3981 RepID=A0A6A6N478_HEVBR|nr:hypothetical protein GH714_017905 [Hevea brasiliensis]
MAAGTMAGAVDLSFSSSASLEIFKLDFQSDDSDLPLVGEFQSSERFNRLAWGRNGSGSDQYSLGLIAGGLVDGSIDIWNPLNLIRSETSEGALVGHLSNHKGPVRGLEFNTFTPNLLASGADDGEICIWDLAAPSEPSHFPPLKGSGSAAQGEISYVSWNCKVQHILASTSLNGITVVWDLKKQKPVISVEDSVRRRCSVLQWHPDVATQLIIASDDDSSPALRLWDMRNTMTPVKEFVGHTKGVIAMSWCPSDSSYLLTCAKDNRTICWNTVTGEIVRELPAGANWNFDVHWYPKIPGVISASSFDGKIGIYNIEGCSRYSAGENDFGAVTLRAPKWYKRPAGVSFGFGGKLVSFHPRSSSASASEVLLHNLVTEHSLVMFEEDGTARTKMLTHLGFSVPVEEKDVVQNDISQQIDSIRLDDTATDKVGYESVKEATVFSADDGEDFFNNLPSPKADTPKFTSINNIGAGHSASYAEEIKQEPDGLEESADPTFDDIIAHVGGSSLWENTRDQYLKMSRSPYLKIVSAMVNNDLMSLVNTRPLKYWKETLALCVHDVFIMMDNQFAQNEEWSLLCNSLAAKLMAAGNTLAATLCFICAGNIDKTVEIWSRNLTTEREGKSYVELLQDLMEKTIVLALASGQKQFSASLCKLVEKYAEILASQGLLSTAMEYLKLLGSDELSPELIILRDCISLSTEPDKDAKSTAFENSQQQGGLMYAEQHSFGMTDASQHYYPENAPSQVHQNVPGSPYSENYQQTLGPSYGRGYGAPTPYQPAPQSATYPLPHNLECSFHLRHLRFLSYLANFAPPQAATQQAVRTFVPSNVPILRNAEQYQQPTLGSHLYPGTANATYQPYSLQLVHKVLFHLNWVLCLAIKYHSPTQSASVQPAVAPAAPPPTVQTVDTSNVPAHHKPVIITLTRLFKETSEALGGSRANPARKREIEDNSRKIGALFAKLNSGDISKNASDKLVQLCQALDKNDFSTALQIQVLLTTSEWDECNFWLATLKRMIKTRQARV